VGPPPLPGRHDGVRRGSPPCGSARTRSFSRTRRLGRFPQRRTPTALAPARLNADGASAPGLWPAPWSILGLIASPQVGSRARVAAVGGELESGPANNAAGEILDPPLGPALLWLLTKVGPKNCCRPSTEDGAQASRISVAWDLTASSSNSSSFAAEQVGMCRGLPAAAAWEAPRRQAGTTRSRGRRRAPRRCRLQDAA
jgi:hypothetical protein